MKDHPSSVLQLVQNIPDYIGHSDSCGLGTGGVWTSGLKSMKPFLWQLRWPDDIRNNLISSSNPKGNITINDLELAGLVLNWLALECQNIPLAFHHIGAFCDNTSAVSWAQRLRTSSSLVAGRLLRLLGLRIHARQASSLVPLHIAGDDNTMADIVSRAFKDGKFFAANKNLTSYFNKHFPLPQETSWTEFQLPSSLTSHVISCLRGQLSPLGSLLRLQRTDKSIGSTGADTLRSLESTPTSLMYLHSNATALSAPMQLESGQVYTAEVLRSRFKRSQMHSRPSARPYSWLATKAPSTEPTKSSTT
jgi:hypothetical protein